MELSKEELETAREWFDSVQNTNALLEPKDYLLGHKLYMLTATEAQKAITRNLLIMNGWGQHVGDAEDARKSGNWDAFESALDKMSDQTLERYWRLICQDQ